MPNQVLLKRDTPIIFGTGGNAFSLANLADSTGFRSARVDMGTGSKPYKFQWRGFFETFTTVGSLNGAQSIDIFIIEYDGTRGDGGYTAATEGSISDTNKRLNLKHIGSVVIDSSGTTSFHGSGTFEMTSRYFSVVVFNYSGVALSSTPANNGVHITPLIEEIQ